MKQIDFGMRRDNTEKAECENMGGMIFKSIITYADFDKVDMRTGRVVRVEDFPEAKKPAYKLWIDFCPQ